jgi:hypothetical protein
MTPPTEHYFLDFFFACLSLSSSLGAGFLTTCFFPPGGGNFFFFFRFSSVNLEGSTLQNSAPKFLITVGDNMGGSAEQPMQFLSGQVDFLNPFFWFCILIVLLEALSFSFSLPAWANSSFDQGPVEGETCWGELGVEGAERESISKGATFESWPGDSTSLRVLST